MNQKKLLDNTNANNIYKGSIDCIIKLSYQLPIKSYLKLDKFCFLMKKTVKTEGFMALYKGFWPSYLRLGPWNVIVNKFCFDYSSIIDIINIK